MKKVLVVEDQNDVRKMMGLMLRQYGFEVTEAADGYDAVEKAVKNKPDMILMDLAMPILDGVQAVRAIRSHDDLLDVPIIAVTAYKEFYDKLALDAGCCSVIQKPLRFDELQALVNSTIRGGSGQSAVPH